MTPEDTVIDAIDFPPKTAKTSADARNHIRQVVKNNVAEIRQQALQDAAEFVRTHIALLVEEETGIVGKAQKINNPKESLLLVKEQEGLADALLRELGGGDERTKDRHSKLENRNVPRRKRNVHRPMV